MKQTRSQSELSCLSEYTPTIPYLLGELCGDSPEVDVSIGEADLTVGPDDWGTKDMMSSSNTLK